VQSEHNTLASNHNPLRQLTLEIIKCRASYHLNSTSSAERVQNSLLISGPLLAAAASHGHGHAVDQWQSHPWRPTNSSSSAAKYKENFSFTYQTETSYFFWIDIFIQRDRIAWASKNFWLYMPPPRRRWMETAGGEDQPMQSRSL